MSPMNFFLLLQVLDILEECISKLGAEKYSTGSVVLPFLKQMLKVLEPEDDEPVYIAKFKRELAADLETRCEDNLDVNLLGKASYFDKRFAQLKFLTETQKEELQSEVLAELSKIEEEEANPIQVEINDNPPKKRKVLGGDLSDEDEETEGAKAEMDSYKAERKLKSDRCPFEWWRERKENYPLMSRLARKYLALQATSTPAERVMSALGFVLNKQRQAMKSELFSEIMFLSDCV